LVPCKAADLKWSTAEAILRNRHSNHTIADQIIEIARGDYERLSVATAQRTLRFMQVREAAK
jgi:Fe2+ or Zn2+ uptake regulation protein